MKTRSNNEIARTDFFEQFLNLCIIGFFCIDAQTPNFLFEVHESLVFYDHIFVDSGGLHEYQI
jgi:hypothetical protein